MSKLKVTPWFTGDVKPVRPGPYERLYDEGTETEEVFMSRFDGEQWFYDQCTNVPSAYQGLSWRGLASKDGK
jgi:hypothetical protein